MSADTEIPEGPVRRLVEAVRRGDTGAFAELFGDSGVVDDWGRVFAGRDRVVFWNDSEFMGLRAQLTIKQVEPRESPVITADIATSGGYVGPATITFFLTEDGEHIRLMLLAD